MEARKGTRHWAGERAVSRARRRGQGPRRGPHGAWRAPASPPASSGRNMTEARREEGGGRQAGGRRDQPAEPPQRRGPGGRGRRRHEGHGQAAYAERRGCGSEWGDRRQHTGGGADGQPSSGVPAGGQSREPSPASSERNMTEACRGSVAGPQAGQHGGEWRLPAAQTGPEAGWRQRVRRARSATCQQAAPEERRRVGASGGRRASGR